MLNKLLEYSRSEAYPFHMPGHKRNLPGDIFPFDIDITEIDGFDNLHHPEGCIREIEDRAAKLYHAERAFLLVNGATCGILSAMRAMTRRGDKVMIARNCHTSVYHAVGLLGLEPVYYLPEPPSGERKHRCFGSVNPILIEKLIRANTDAKLLVITSPTYEGFCSDVPSIAALCRSYGVRLLVDAALREEPALVFHPCVNTASLRISGADFFGKYLPALGYAPTFVEIHDFKA